MKKMYCVFAFLMTFMLFGCSKTVTCSFCGETKEGNTYTLVDDSGNEAKADLCDDCYSLIKLGADLMGYTIK